MASFHDKTGWERPRKGEKKIIVPINSYPTCNSEFQKNRKRIQKIKKHHYDFFSNQNGLVEAQKERKKIYRSDISYLTRNRKFKKKSKKIQKIKKTSLWLLFNPKRVRRG